MNKPIATTPAELRDLAERCRRCEHYPYGGAAFHEASLVLERYAAEKERAVPAPTPTKGETPHEKHIPNHF